MVMPGPCDLSRRRLSGPVPWLAMTRPETEITADLVRDLLEEQHPDLAGLTIREVAGGWGNQMWRLGDEWALRLRHLAPPRELQLRERRCLPVLAPRLPL